MKRILVTGASGFVGGALAPFLAQRGHEVLCTSRRPVSLSGARLTAVVSRYGDPRALGPLLAGCDVVVHLAAPAHRASSGGRDDPAEYDASVTDTASLASACAEAGVRRFLFVSSIGVNGNADAGIPFEEASEPHPAEPYAMGKWQAESALRAIAARSPGLELVVLRPPLVYGRDAPGNFRRIARAVERGVPLPLGGLANPRSFIGLDNLLHLIELCCHHPAAAGELFLVSDGEDVAMSEFIVRMGLAMKRPARLFRLPTPWMRLAARSAGYETEFQRLAASLRVNSSKSRRTLGWTPPFTLDEGLRRAVGPRAGTLG
jgi:nucleoside-diphosphate-sugar epimerase